MGLVIAHSGMLLKINTEKNCIEYSKNDGRSWHFQGSINREFGLFQDLSSNGNEILGITSKGTCYSKNDGKSWHKR